MAQKLMLFSGFLGSGKTTTMVKTAQFLKTKGINVALITNDLGSNLVDTRFAEIEGVPVMEIPNGCLCHDVPNFIKTVDTLVEKYSPDIVFAEPVGSCVDLVRSVYCELNTNFAEKYELLPFVGVVDPRRYDSIYIHPELNSFNDEATYMYKKQLEDADLIVLNKLDLIDEAMRETVLASLKENFPEAAVVAISALNSDGLEGWTGAFTNGQTAALRELDIDWDYICSGDEHMGWYNSTVKLVSVVPADYDGFTLDYLTEVQKKFREKNLEIAHLKTMAVSEKGYNKAALTSAGDEIRFAHRIGAKTGCCTMNINIRAIAEPDVMGEIMDSTLKELTKARKMRMQHTQMQSFGSFDEAPEPCCIC